MTGQSMIEPSVLLNNKGLLSSHIKKRKEVDAEHLWRSHRLAFL